MIKSFSCQNFRNINVADLKFEKVNILIGPNNSGKSNFIKALTFYSDILVNGQHGGFQTAFLNTIARYGWEHTHSMDTDKRAPVRFSWDIDLAGKPVRYTFSYVVGTELKDNNIVLEELDGPRQEHHDQPFNFFRCHQPKIGVGNFSTAIQEGRRNKRLRSFDLDSQEILPMQFKDILLQNGEIYADDKMRDDITKLLNELEAFFRGFFVHVGIPFNIQKIRDLSEVKNPDYRLSSDAANFVSVFSRYKAENLLWKTRFEKKMRDLIPTLETTDVVQIRNHTAFAMVFDGKQYDLSDVSDGTIKGLVLNMLVNAPYEKKQALLALDEPEANLHPAWQKVLGQWLLCAENYEQVFVGTHSPDLLDTFTEAFKEGGVGVFVFDPGGQETIKKIEYEDIVDDLGDWELGDLYRTNDPALGGWPW